MEPQFNVVFTGEMTAGSDRDTFIQAFSEKFKTDQSRAAEIFDAGSPVTMKTGVNQATANEFKNALEALGMVVRLEPVAATAVAQPAASAAVAEANPYQAPSAQLEEEPAFDEMTGPVSVPMGHGLGWITSAFSNYVKASPGAWIGAILVFTIMSVMPMVNMVVSLLMPVFIGGIMLGARAQDGGDEFKFEHLFQGFKQNTGQLVIFSVIFMVVMFILIFVFMGVMFGSIAMAESSGVSPDPMVMLLPMLVIMLIVFPLMMAYWFSPALIAIDGLPALTAMKLSFIGCLKNILPMLLYSIVLTVLMVVAMIPLFLGLLVLLPVMYASMYTAYRDIYYPEA
ncbi:MAG: BPSS1780 family membrane protein [Chromatiales bacterium]|nr:BPSS1780 family membrane protein [Chromatiales bacterium]